MRQKNLCTSISLQHKVGSSFGRTSRKSRKLAIFVQMQNLSWLSTTKMIVRCACGDLFQLNTIRRPIKQPTNPRISLTRLSKKPASYLDDETNSSSTQQDDLLSDARRLERQWIIVDTYGEREVLYVTVVVPSLVRIDEGGRNSAAYAALHCQNIVAAGLAKQMQLAYAIG